MGTKGLWLGKESFALEHNPTEKKFRGISYSGKEITDRLVFADDGQIYGKLVIDVNQAHQRTRSMGGGAMNVGVFYNHDQNQVVGSGTLAFANDIKIEGQFSNFTEKAKEVHGLMSEGFPMQQSVYVETDQIEGISSGSVNVNGQEFQAPIAIFRNGFIREVSLCPIAADPNTSTEIFTISNESQETLKHRWEQQQKGEKKMNLEKFTFMSDEQKEKYAELVKSDAFAAHEFACSCQEKHEEATKDEEDETPEEDKVAAKAAADQAEELKASKKEIETLKAKNVQLESDLAESKKVTEELVEVDASLFEREHNKTGNVQLKNILERTKVLQKEKGLGFNQAYSQAKAEELNSAA